MQQNSIPYYFWYYRSFIFSRVACDTMSSYQRPRHHLLCSYRLAGDNKSLNLHTRIQVVYDDYIVDGASHWWTNQIIATHLLRLWSLPRYFFLLAPPAVKQQANIT